MDKRTWAQIISTLLHNPHLNHLFTGQLERGVTKMACVPGLNCYSCPASAGACPLGSLQSFLSGVFPRFPTYVLGTMMLFGLLFGRFICGWVCPFGFFQELVHHIPGPKIRKSKATIVLSKLKYLWAILFVIVIPIAYWALTGTGIPAFCKFLCPAGTLEGAVPLLTANEGLRGAMGSLTIWKFAVAGVFLLLMVSAWRPFCRWLCPLGAFYGLFNHYAISGIQVDASKCIHCGKCARDCQMDTMIAGDQECISCGKCLKDCPTEAISFRRPSIH